MKLTRVNRVGSHISTISLTEGIIIEASSCILTAPSGLVQDKNYDPRGLLSSITTRDNASAVLKNFIYGLNSLGQRTTITREDSAVLAIGYDARRQVISGQKTTAGSSFPAYDFRYAFDEMGNRKSAGSSAQPTAITYATNPLNQYTTITQASLSLNPTVDLNGSTLNDGRTVSTWDERNQRRSVTQTATGEQLFCKFDAVGRRTEEQELSATNSELRKTRYLYDGWNCVAEFAVTPVTAALVRKKTHTWDLDLSQTPQGAGGVGGLLATVDETATKAIYTAAYDGNGNVAALYTNSFSPAASYEYDPFGKTLSASGAYAAENKYRFSTKPQDRIGGLYYYGYRYYDPVIGRWPSRDPIEEKGGINLHGFSENNPIQKVDVLGKGLLVSLLYIIPGVGTILNAAISPSGSDVSDYDYSTNPCECEVGVGVSECQKRVGFKFASYAADYWLLIGAHGLADAGLAIITSPSVIIPVIIAGDALLDGGISWYKYGNMMEASNFAKSLCECTN